MAASRACFVCISQRKAATTQRKAGTSLPAILYFFFPGLSLSARCDASRQTPAKRVVGLRCVAGSTSSRTSAWKDPLNAKRLPNREKADIGRDFQITCRVVCCEKEVEGDAAVLLHTSLYLLSCSSPVIPFMDHQNSLITVILHVLRCVKDGDGREW